MPGDPKECRLHAMRCAELAATAKTQQLKATLLDLSKNWVRLAASLERKPMHCWKKMLGPEMGEYVVVTTSESMRSQALRLAPLTAAST
jgi:hypothetical protein